MKTEPTAQTGTRTNEDAPTWSDEQVAAYARLVRATLHYQKSASLGACSECGSRTNQMAITRDSVYPYVHKHFKCARCQRKK